MNWPRALFFSGGTALADLSHELARLRLDSIHLVTTFDSGGSSAELRKTFAMPAVGDLRNRLLALADTAITPASVLKFCNTRLGSSPQAARAALVAMGDPKHPVWAEMPDDYAGRLKRGLYYFLSRMPAAFNAAGASLGNLLLTGHYLEHDRDLDAALAYYSQLLHVRGTVLPIVKANLSLGARLANGRIIIGQHIFHHLPAPVEWLFLTVHESGRPLEGANPIACRPDLLPAAVSHLATADTIIYPMGSFYSSLLPNLLPKGVGTAIAGSRAAKVFIPNSGCDVELLGLPIVSQAKKILRVLAEDAPGARNRDFLRFILIDGKNGVYPGGTGSDFYSEARALGLEVIDRPVVTATNPQKHDPQALMAALAGIAAGQVRP